MTHLYVTIHGTNLGIEGGHVIISEKSGMITKVPKESVESVSLFSNASISTQCARFLLEKGIATCYFSPTSKYFGRLESTRHVNITRQKKQIKTFDDYEVTLCLAKEIIEAKILNQSVILSRYIKENNNPAIKNLRDIKTCEKMVVMAKSKEELVGYEGHAARVYFDGISKIIEADFSFKGRSRRPPKDPFNAMLSLGYTLLMYEIVSKIQIKGLHPYAGFLHEDSNNHPTLASDLMEEWRAVIVDSVVLSLIQGHEVTIDDFEVGNEDGGVYLRKDGMKKFLNKFEKKLNTQTKYLKRIDKSVSFRNAIIIQIEALVKLIEDKENDRGNNKYEAIRIR